MGQRATRRLQRRLRQRSAVERASVAGPRAAVTPGSLRKARGGSRGTAAARRVAPARIALDALGMFLLAAGVVATARYFEGSLGIYDEGIVLTNANLVLHGA